MFVLLSILYKYGLYVLFMVGLMLAMTAGPSQEEIKRIQSPDGLVDAVVVETNGGATTSFGYKVYIVPKGLEFSEKYLVAKTYGSVLSDGEYGVDVFWEDNMLQVEYATGRTMSDETRPEVLIDGFTYTIQVKKGVF